MLRPVGAITPTDGLARAQVVGRAAPPSTTLAPGVDGPVVARRDGPVRPSGRPVLPPPVIPTGGGPVTTISATLEARPAGRLAAARICAAPWLPPGVIRDVRMR